MLFIGDCWLLESVCSSGEAVGQWVSGLVGEEAKRRARGRRCRRTKAGEKGEERSSEAGVHKALL